MKLARIINRSLTLATHKITNLPVLVIMPHSRCNCRCVMCDIWKANATRNEITAEELERHVGHFKRLGVREIVFSGGEALMHSNLWKLCSVLRNEDIAITLLSTGLLMERNASEIVSNFREVIVSVDGSPEVHDRIRNIPNGFKKIVDGIHAIRAIDQNYRITARCVLQRYNFDDFFNILTATEAAGISQISFLPADVSTNAFNHDGALTPERVHEIALSAGEANRFESIVEESLRRVNNLYASRFIAESPAKMKKIVAYYKAINGLSQFPGAVCNAPWVSAVIESDGRVMPCFFHQPYGNINGNDFSDLINSDDAIEFRKNLNVDTDPICRKCVCSLKLGRMEMV